LDNARCQGYQWKAIDVPASVLGFHETVLQYSIGIKTPGLIDELCLQGFGIGNGKGRWADYDKVVPANMA